MAENPTFSLDGVHIVSHPLFSSKLSVLRLASTSSKEFREGIHDLTFLLGLEASRDVEVTTFQGTTPLGATFTGTAIAPRIGLAPILRAGLGLFREKVSLQPVECFSLWKDYSKLPRNPSVDLCFLLDPLVASGGTSCAAINMILDWGIPIHSIKLLAVLASKMGLERIHSEFPELEIWVAGVDDTLTSEGLICPGLGDAGDRLFHTT